MIAKRILVEYLEMKKKIVEGKDGIGLDGFDGDEGRRKRHGEIMKTLCCNPQTKTESM
jgi:hypothetical protein